MLLLTCDVATHDRFEWYDLRLFDEDGAALQFLSMLVQLIRHLFDARSHDVVRNDAFQLFEPKQGELRQDAALVRHALVTGETIVAVIRLEGRRKCWDIKDAMEGMGMGRGGEGRG